MIDKRFFSAFIALSSFSVFANSNVENVSEYIKNADLNRQYNAIIKQEKKFDEVDNIRNKAAFLASYEFYPSKLKRNDYGLSFTNGKSGVLIPNESSEKIKLFKSDIGRSKNLYGNKFFDFGGSLLHKSLNSAESYFEIGLPNQNRSINKKAEIASDNSVVYLGYDQYTDIAVQAFEDSGRILTLLNSTESPTEYSYEIIISNGGELKKDDESGGVVILDYEGNFLGGFAPPWAVDSSGKEIPTHYEIRDNYLVQIINHTDHTVDYPIVADPYFGYNLISHAYWRQRSNGITFSVIPTTWARWQGGGYLPGVYGWNELVNRYYYTISSRTRNFGGMRDQYICHQQFAFYKSSWNLEPWRPDVSYSSTVANLCNP